MYNGCVSGDQNNSPRHLIIGMNGVFEYHPHALSWVYSIKMTRPTAIHHRLDSEHI